MKNNFKKSDFFLKKACRYEKRSYLCTRNQQRTTELKTKAGAVVQFG